MTMDFVLRTLVTIVFCAFVLYRLRAQGTCWDLAGLAASVGSLDLFLLLLIYMDAPDNFVETVTLHPIPSSVMGLILLLVVALSMKRAKKCQSESGAGFRGRE